MKTKKFLSVLLLIAMCFSFMAVSASADVLVTDSTIISGSAAEPQSEPESENQTVIEGTDEIIAQSDDSIYDPEYIEGESVEPLLADAPSILALGEQAKVYHSDNTTESYTDFAEALENAADGEKIELLTNVYMKNEKLIIKNEIELDLNEFTLTIEAGKDTKGSSAIVLDAKKASIYNGTIVIKDGDNGKNPAFVFADGINTQKNKLSLSCTVEFKSAPKAPAVEGLIIGEGTYYFNPEKYIDQNVFSYVDNGDGSYNVNKSNNAAKIGDKQYASAGEAIKAAQDGETVVLLRNVKPGDITVDKNITVNLAGHTWEGNIKVAAEKTLMLTQGLVNGSITVDGTLDILEKISVTGTVTVSANAKLNVKSSEVKVSDIQVETEKQDAVNIPGGTYDNFAALTLTKYNITGGAFQSIVSDYLPEGYFLQETEIDGVKYQAVTAKGAATIDPANAEMVVKSAPDAGISFTLGGAVDGVKVNGTAVSQPSYSVSTDRKTITFAKAYLDTLEVGEYTLSFSVVNSTGASAKLTVKEAAKLWLEMTADEFTKGSANDLVFHCNYEISNPKINLDGANFTAISSDNVVIDNTNKTIALKAAYLNTDAFKKDTSYSLNVDTVKGPALASFKVVEKSSSVIVSLTDMNGAAPGTINFFKGEAEKAQNVDTTLKCAPAIRRVLLDGSEIGIENYSITADTVTVKKDAPAFKTLAAGLHKLSFEFEVPGKTITRDVDLMVYPSMVIVPTRYLHKSGADIKITVSDKGDALIAGTAADKLEYVPSEYFSYDEASRTYTLKGAYLDAKPAGTFYLGITMSGKAVLGAITIAPVASISFNEVNKEGKWENNGSGLSFDVKPDVKAVYIDGVAVDSGKYVVSDKGVLTLKYSLLDSLSYGKHKIIVTTSDGNTNELEFITKCGIAPKNGDKHTKGGRKNLDFVCSDPIKKVMVGTETLKSDQYILSKDAKTLTLKAEFMNKLRADRTFQLTIETIDGCVASTYFKILSPGAASGTPTTGDESNLMVWAAVLLLSGAGIVALIPRKKNQ